MAASPFKPFTPPDWKPPLDSAPQIRQYYVTDSSSYAALREASMAGSMSYSGVVVSASASVEGSYLKQTAGSDNQVHLVATSQFALEPRVFPDPSALSFTDEVMLVLDSSSPASCMHPFSQVVRSCGRA